MQKESDLLMRRALGLCLFVLLVTFSVWYYLPSRETTTIVYYHLLDQEASADVLPVFCEDGQWRLSLEQISLKSDRLLGALGKSATRDLAITLVLQVADKPSADELSLAASLTDECGRSYAGQSVYCNRIDSGATPTLRYLHRFVDLPADLKQVSLAARVGSLTFEFPRLTLP